MFIRHIFVLKLCVRKWISDSISEWQFERDGNIQIRQRWCPGPLEAVSIDLKPFTEPNMNACQYSAGSRVPAALPIELGASRRNKE